METNIFQSGGIGKAGLARPTPIFMQPEVRMDTSLITVSYAYDSLYRLTAANYSDGNFFHYTYDAAGRVALPQRSGVSNRLTETTRFGTNIYVYDAANRLVSVNAVNYTWDNNGNLLSDGEYTYTYDHANRLKTVTDGFNTSSYSYNGLGDRVSETVNEITTDYVLDLAGGLTQVLAEGTNSYLYGNARIMQENSSEEKEYFLGDALGSVRMLADEEGEITLLRSYEPYGEVLSSQGSGETSYSFTGEQYDPQTGLVYLRARYYSTASGRFMSRDTWTGDEGMPMSYNAWLYTYANPINYNDPSGKYIDCPIGSYASKNGCSRKPVVISRQEWGAYSPRNNIVCDPLRGVCIPSYPIGEGIYDLECNPHGGYAFYSDLYPEKTLAEIYDTIVIHHAGNTNNPTIINIQKEHFDQGFADIGYHFMVDKNGLIYAGRNIGVRGAHVEGGNSGKIGILVAGDFEPDDYVDLPLIGEIKIKKEPADVLSKTQEQSLENLVDYLDFLYTIDLIAGHNHFNTTRCPGINLDYTVVSLNYAYGN